MPQRAAAFLRKRAAGPHQPNLVGRDAVAEHVPEAVADPSSDHEPAPSAAAKKYANCDALHVDYPHGVGRPGATDHTSGKPVTNFTVNQSVYDANTARDGDKDGIACEKA